MGSIQRAMRARATSEGVTDIRKGEWRSARALQSRGLAFIYCNQNFTPVIIFTA